MIDKNLMPGKFNNHFYSKKLIKNRHFCVVALKKIVPARLVVKIEPSSYL